MLLLLTLHRRVYITYYLEFVFLNVTWCNFPQKLSKDLLIPWLHCIAVCCRCHDAFDNPHFSSSILLHFLGIPVSTAIALHIFHCFLMLNFIRLDSQKRNCIANGYAGFRSSETLANYPLISQQYSCFFFLSSCLCFFLILQHLMWLVFWI